MITIISKWTVVLFGAFIIFVGFIMLFVPKKARATLRKAGSTDFINYMEITIRLIPAVALILYADFCKFPEVFKIFGWIMLSTSLILYILPRKKHHNFSLKSAEILKPICFQLISPLAFLFGGLIIFNVL
ncbi:hypothetical protein [Maribacter sp. ACAM166]|uniref:hypothetical protein n=1 Tax=Maribacter sp. ACAM166 TaxID=2508996 RepID=UPI0010FF3051|nr:hypothetical protein [Maribacter sp. ACAM166]TLP80225.1 hypothetical protein ES765_08500 [Maribacter sp. ACAM166]